VTKDNKNNDPIILHKDAFSLLLPLLLSLYHLFLFSTTKVTFSDRLRLLLDAQDPSFVGMTRHLNITSGSI
jgi:hypothetical protein